MWPQQMARPAPPPATQAAVLAADAAAVKRGMPGQSSANWSSMSLPTGAQPTPAGSSTASNQNMSPRRPHLQGADHVPTYVAPGTPVYPGFAQQQQLHSVEWQKGAAPQHQQQQILQGGRSLRSSSWSPAALAETVDRNHRLQAWWRPAEQPPPLAVGEVVTIGQLTFRVEHVLGEGTYARVWAARAEQQEAAIKEMRCGEGYGILPGATRARAEFEVSVMQQLQHHPGQDILRAPRVLDFQVWPFAEAPGTYLMRVGMTRCSGQPLDVWLDCRCASIAAHRQTQAAGAAHCCESLLAAVGMVSVMLRQLMPTFDRLNTYVAFHRDVNARNLLVHTSDAVPEPEPEDAESAMSFWLVDFGAARSSSEWLGFEGEGSWRQENPTGDARYWGPASWARLQEGPEALDQVPGLRWQYTQGLDMVALATCAVESLCRLQAAECPLLDSAEGAGESVQDKLLCSVRRLQQSWSDYWALALSSFNALAQYSSEALLGGSTALAAWEKLLQADTPRTLRVRLLALCGSLAELAQLCTSAAEAAAVGKLSSLGGRSSKAASWQEAATTLLLLHDMLSEDAKVSWGNLIERQTAKAAFEVSSDQRLDLRCTKSIESLHKPYKLQANSSPAFGQELSSTVVKPFSEGPSKATAELIHEALSAGLVSMARFPESMAAAAFRAALASSIQDSERLDWSLAAIDTRQNSPLLAHSACKAHGQAALLALMVISKDTLEREQILAVVDAASAREAAEVHGDKADWAGCFKGIVYAATHNR